MEVTLSQLITALTDSRVIEALAEAIVRKQGLRDDTRYQVRLPLADLKRELKEECRADMKTKGGKRHDCATV